MYSPGEIFALVIGGIIFCAFGAGVIVPFFPKTLKKLDLDD